MLTIEKAREEVGKVFAAGLAKKDPRVFTEILARAMMIQTMHARTAAFQEVAKLLADLKTRDDALRAESGDNAGPLTYESVESFFGAFFEADAHMSKALVVEALTSIDALVQNTPNAAKKEPGERGKR